MIDNIRKRYKLSSPEVFVAMSAIPREKFISDDLLNRAYDDCALPIGFGATISQPYTVALMTHLVVRTNNKQQTTDNTQQRTKNKERKLNNRQGRTKILEIGTGSGYQAAVLSKLFDWVYSIEIVPELSKRAKKVVKELGIKNVEFKIGNGSEGWVEKLPFDAIIVTAGMERVYKNLLDQLEINGVLVAPIGKGESQMMTRYTRNSGSKYRKETFGSFNFVKFVDWRHISR